MLSLPSPQRTIARSLRVCRRMGYTRDQAAQLVIAACQGAIMRAVELGGLEPTWLLDLHTEAHQQWAKLAAKATPPDSGQGQPERKPE